MIEKATIRRKATIEAGQESARLAVLWVFPELEGRLSVLAPGLNVLGRDFDVDIRLPGDETSRRHAEIVKEPGFALIRDLDSTNGVFVDGLAVPKARLDEGSVVRIGDWVGVIVRIEGNVPDPIFREIVPGYFGGPKTLAAIEPLRSAARSDLPVIVEGETGTGKEGVARATHEWSGRTGPFVAVNCAALPESLAESLLFGHRKGAFTGADRASVGYFQAAHRGTLFLDEVADLSAALQPKLLRALEQREVIPLGEAKAVPVDIRVVVATQRPLADSVKEKRFRQDLFARLDGLRVSLPPLRDRVEEVPYLFNSVMAAKAEGRAPGMDAPFVERLCCYEWPSNIRELTLVVRKVLALHAEERTLKRAHIPWLVPRPEGLTDEESVVVASLTAQELDDRGRIVQALAESAGSQIEAARRLNVSRGTLVDRIKRYGIPRPRAGREAKERDATS